MNRIVFTGGQLSAGDLFDTNKYAHDPRADFINWALLGAGAFDYAAGSWGYTAGAAPELYQGRWTLPGGAFRLSDVPNSEFIDTRLKQFQLVAEVEERHTLLSHPGKIKLAGFVSRAQMGRFDDAARAAQRTGQPADTAALRRYASRSGVSVNLEQQFTDDLGLFARAGVADGAYESFDFTDVDRTLSGGASLTASAWAGPTTRSAWRP